MKAHESGEERSNKILEEQRSVFLRRIDNHTLSVAEHSQGRIVDPLQITEVELKQLIKSGVVKEKNLSEYDAYPPQAILSVSFQEEVLEITITDIGIVQIHRYTKSEPIAISGPNPLPAKSVSILRGGFIGKLLKAILG